MCNFFNRQKSLRRSPLGVKIYHTVVVKHQNCAIYLLNFLKELAEKSGNKLYNNMIPLILSVSLSLEGFSRLIAMVVVQPSLSSDNQCLLDRFFDWCKMAPLWILHNEQWSMMNNDQWIWLTYMNIIKEATSVCTFTQYSKATWTNTLRSCHQTLFLVRGWRHETNLYAVMIIWLSTIIIHHSRGKLCVGGIFPLCMKPCVVIVCRLVVSPTHLIGDYNHKCHSALMHLIVGHANVMYWLI